LSVGRHVCELLGKKSINTRPATRIDLFIYRTRYRNELPALELGNVHDPPAAHRTDSTASIEQSYECDHRYQEWPLGIFEMRLSLPVYAFLALGTASAFVPGRGAFERILKVSGPVDLDVLSEIGGVTVTVGASDVVRIRALLSAQWGPIDLAAANERIRALERDPPVDQTGNRLRIGYPADPESLKRISMRLEIEVPRATAIRARTGSGGIRIEGTHGSIDGESRSGRIVISDTKGDVSIRTRSAGIFITNAHGRVVVHDESGAIEASNVAGEIDATNGSGAIRLSQSIAASVRAHARSGAIKVKLVPQAAYTVVARSESGKVLVPDIPSGSGQNSRQITGSLGGGGPLVDVRTGSSSISIER
jgi:hypothetical protein